jgi:hypothetical protein
MRCDDATSAASTSADRSCGAAQRRLQIAALVPGHARRFVALARWPAVLLGLTMLVSGCATHPDYATQFRFPVEWGSIVRGQQAFVDLQCHQCHVVNGVSLAPYPGTMPVTVELGGEMIFAKTYADLVTSIVNPNHELADSYLSTLPRDERKNARSIMPLKEQMTVAQLIDLVTFLNSRYVLMDGYQEIYYR